MKKTIKATILVLSLIIVSIIIINRLEFRYLMEVPLDCEEVPETNLPYGYHYDSLEIFIYYPSGIYGCSIGKVKMEGADKQSFEVLSFWYSKDRNFVYYVQIDSEASIYKIHEADPKTFEIIDSEYVGWDDVFGKDKNNVFFGRVIIENADPNTFEVLSSHYSKDKNYVYYKYSPWDENIRRLEGINPATFEILDTSLVKDNNGIYYVSNKGPQKIEGAESDTIDTISRIDLQKGDYIYIFDDNNIWVFIEKENKIYKLNQHPDQFDFDQDIKELLKTL